MKKLFLIALAISAFVWLGCGDTMTDQMGTNAPNGTAVDLDSGVYVQDFSGHFDSYMGYQYWQPLGGGDKFIIIDRRMTVASLNNYGDLLADGYTHKKATFFGIRSKNYTVIDAASVNFNAATTYTITARFGNPADNLKMIIGAATDLGLPNGAIIAVLNQDLSAAGGTAHDILIMIATTMNATGYLPVARAAIPSFAVDTDYTFRIAISNDAVYNTNGPSFSISLDGTEVIGYNGSTGAFTPTTTMLIDAQQNGILGINDGDTADGLPAATWLQHWTGFVWGDATTILDTSKDLETRKAATTQQIGFKLYLTPAVNTTGPSVSYISIGR